MRKVLLASGVLALALIGFVASIAVTFFSYAPAKNLAKLPGGAMLVSDGTSNVYILRNAAGRAVLVDCGLDPKMDAVAAELGHLGLNLNAVEAVLITHAHTDHIGGCAAVPNATLYAMSADRPFIEGREVIPNFFSKLTFAKPEPTGLKVTGLSDAQTLQIAGLAVTAYAIPGHTPGSAAYLINGVLYIGDTAGITKDGKTAPAPWIFNADGTQAEASLKALAERLRRDNVKVDMVATGHSGPGLFSALP